MSRGSIIGWGAFILLFGLVFAGPLPFWHDEMRPQNYFAWAMVSAPIAGFSTFAAFYIFADDSAPDPKPKALDTPFSWKDALAVTFGMWVFLMYFVTAFTIDEYGFGDLIGGSYWGLAGFLFVFCLVISAFLGLTLLSQQDIDKESQRRLAARHGRPSDLAVFGVATAADRGAWYANARPLARRLLVGRLCVSVPAVAFVAVASGSAFPFVMPDLIAYALALLVALVAVALVTLDVRAQLGDPMLLVGRVSGCVYGVVLTHGEAPGLREKARNLLQYGHWNTIEVSVEDAYRLGADGSLAAAPDWGGDREIGARRKVYRGVIEGEQCVLLCAGNGSVLYELSDLAGQLRQASLPAAD